MKMVKVNTEEYIRSFDTLGEIIERLESLKKQGFNFYDYIPDTSTPTQYFFTTPSGRELTIQDLKNFIQNTSKIEMGNLEHIENLELIEFDAIQNYLKQAYPNLPNIF